MAEQKGPRKQGKHRGGDSIAHPDDIFTGSSKYSPAHLGRGELGARRAGKPKAPACSSCGAVAKLCTGREVYANAGMFASALFWKCPACTDSHCGCQPHSDLPLGTPGDARTRAARQAAHLIFDPMWKSRAGLPLPPLVVSARRSAAYVWLAAAMGIPVEECHIGLFDYNRCRQAMSVIAANMGKTIAPT